MKPSSVQSPCYSVILRTAFVEACSELLDGTQMRYSYNNKSLKTWPLMMWSYTFYKYYIDCCNFAMNFAISMFIREKPSLGVFHVANITCGADGRVVHIFTLSGFYCFLGMWYFTGWLDLLFCYIIDMLNILRLC